MLGMVSQPEISAIQSLYVPTVAEEWAEEVSWPELQEEDAKCLYNSDHWEKPS